MLADPLVFSDPLISAMRVNVDHCDGNQPGIPQGCRDDISTKPSVEEEDQRSFRPRSGAA